MKIRPARNNDRIIIEREGRARHLAPCQPYYSRQMGVFDRAKRSRLSVETRGARGVACFGMEKIFQPPMEWADSKSR